MAGLKDQILARELGKLGGFGAKLVARILTTEDFETTFNVSAAASVVYHPVCEVLSRLGHFTDELGNEATVNHISVIVGSGILNLNPTVVSIGITPAGENETCISIHAWAKEGLIKQHSAEKAVTRIKNLLIKRFEKE